MSRPREPRGATSGRSSPAPTAASGAYVSSPALLAPDPMTRRSVRVAMTTTPTQSTMSAPKRGVWAVHLHAMASSAARTAAEAPAGPAARAMPAPRTTSAPVPRAARASSAARTAAEALVGPAARAMPATLATSACASPTAPARPAEATAAGDPAGPAHRTRPAPRTTSACASPTAPARPAETTAAGDPAGPALSTLPGCPSKSVTRPDSVSASRIALVSVASRLTAGSIVVIAPLERSVTTPGSGRTFSRPASRSLTRSRPARPAPPSTTGGSARSCLTPWSVNLYANSTPNTSLAWRALQGSAPTGPAPVTAWTPTPTTPPAGSASTLPEREPDTTDLKVRIQTGT